MSEPTKSEMHAIVDAEWKGIIDRASALDPFHALSLFKLWRVEKQCIDAGIYRPKAQPSAE